ncbi:uncharacterized protein isoform X2 [Rhodnius prolixus]|uniref:C2H2-type domain-containing protein n=1 Tax=Rhodnius prolixus TaxID=13249 RepID=T1IC06_RHOPR
MFEPWNTFEKEKNMYKEEFTKIICDFPKKNVPKKEYSPTSPGLPPGILTPPPSVDQEKSQLGKDIPPHLPKMFLDLLEPVQGLRIHKLDFVCPICTERFATTSSLDTHNKSHFRPACLKCHRRFPTANAMFKHRRSNSCTGTNVSSIADDNIHHDGEVEDEEVVDEEPNTVFVTSKYGRARNVKSFIGFS